MNEQTLATRTDVPAFGSRNEIAVLAKRFEVMLPGGKKLNESEKLALAQVSLITRLNPFIGEIWYIPGKGIQIGIAGARRLDNEAMVKAGGRSWPTFTLCPPEEAGVTTRDLPHLAAAIKCEISDSVENEKHFQALTEMINSLTRSGCTDPAKEARAAIGPRPSWIGYGYSTVTEESRMNKVQLARKRAHADALKQRIIVPFGVSVAVTDTRDENVVDAQFKEA